MTIRIIIPTAVAATALGLIGCSAPTTASPVATSALTPGVAAPGTRADPGGEVTAGADWSAVAAKVAPGVVAVSVLTDNSAGQGSGVVIDDEGHIVTNHHVMGGPGAEIIEHRPRNPELQLWGGKGGGPVVR
jgi:putative serine protease PepD